MIYYTTMKAEIISIGTELLTGQTLNTNICFLGEELQSLGIELYFQTSVDDNTGHIQQVINQALKRADLIITTGGLGPTTDDLTHHAVFSFFKAKPLLDKKVLKQIKNKFHLKGYKKMPKSNKKQAYKPKQAKWIDNKLGTANGVIWKTNSKTIMTFPGVPRELKQMWKETAKPFLKKTVKGNAIYSTTLKYTGIGESPLAEKINKFFKLKNPIVAPYASIGEVKIKITGQGKSKKEAKKVTDKTTKQILSKTKQYYFGKDNETLEELLAKKLISQKKTISIAESCTGGLLSKRLTDRQGSSKYIKLNVVTYADESKIKLLGVPKEVLKTHGAVSLQVASLMAKGIQKLSSSDIGLSITGIAGPTGSTKEKPIGLVYFGLAKGKKVKTQKVLFGSNSTRYSVRQRATQFALSWLNKEI